MQFDLTSEQAATLSSAAHLVMEYLPVSEKKRKALKDAQQALHKGLGYKRLFHTNDLLTPSQLSKSELRGFMIYNNYGYPGIDYPSILLTVGYDQTQEDVFVTLVFAGAVFLVEKVWDDDKEETYEGVRYPNSAFYGFPVWHGAKVQLTISTPSGKKGAVWLFTKQGVVTELQMVRAVIRTRCTGG